MRNNLVNGNIIITVCTIMVFFFFSLACRRDMYNFSEKLLFIWHVFTHCLQELTREIIDVNETGDMHNCLEKSFAYLSMFPRCLRELSRGIMDDNHTSWASKERKIEGDGCAIRYYCCRI